MKRLWPIDHDSTEPQVVCEKNSGDDVTEKLGGIAREFFVDFLGGLLPGFFFMMVVSPLVAWSSLIIWQAILLSSPSSPTRMLPQMIHSLRIEYIFPLLVLSYVTGCIFHRQDPKKPDFQSSKYILRGMSCEERERHVIPPFTSSNRPDTRGGAWRWITILQSLLLKVPSVRKRHEIKEAVEKGGQFPYSNLKGYLSKRGLDRLAAMIPWEPGNDIDHRTKMFINVLKIRLQCVAPGRCGEIIRTEAHVRMMSSLWYASRALRSVSMLILIPCFVFLFAMRRPIPEHWWRLLTMPELRGLVVSNLAVIGGATFLQFLIRRFFHYQRVREIVYVLETAQFVAIRDGCMQILDPPVASEARKIAEEAREAMDHGNTPTRMAIELLQPSKQPEPNVDGG
jgi:hypothetical protein